MAEALINAKMGDCVQAQSSGVQASGKVNATVKELLKKNDLWRDEYHSKVIETVINTPFDLVVTVCDNAKETCPVFPNAVKTLHMGFEDPSRKNDESAYIKALELINSNLLPIIKKELCK
jgi:arsenate reductase